MGAILTARIPLSLSALQSLYRAYLPWQISGIVTRLGSLLTGTAEDHLPLQILHLSLREFLVDRARSSPEAKRFHINPGDHHNQLALSCLTIMNHDMDPAIPALGYLTSPPPYELLAIAEGPVSDALWYACYFWVDHFMEIGALGPDIADATRVFLSEHFVSWVEVLSSRGEYQSVAGLSRTLEVGRTIKSDLHFVYDFVPDA